MYKAVFFDVDGTLVQSINPQNKLEHEHSVWTLLHRYYDVMDAAGEQYKAYKEGILSYDKWVRDNVALWMEKGATKTEILKIISEFTQVTQGAHELIQTLKNKGVKCFVISGGVRLLVDHYFPSTFDKVFANELVFEEEKLVGGTHTEYDFSGKADALKKVCAEENISLEETVFIGDNKNDIDILQAAGLGIAFNCECEKTKQAANIVMESRNILDVLKYVEKDI